MAEEWVKDAPNEAKVEANLRAETSKALGAAKQKNQELTTKLTAEERERRSAEAGLKNTQDQTEEQRKKLHYVEIELATTKQQVADLKAELRKAKEAARTAKEVAKAQASYDLGVQETEVHLVEELVEVCRDYYWKVWAETLNLAGVPATSGWRKAENIYYPPNIHEVPATLPLPTAPASTSSEQPSITQALFLLLRSPKSLARLVTKVKGLRWLRVKGLARVVLGQRIRARVRRSSPC